MRELSQHLADLVENALHAGATEITVTLEEDASCLKITVEDNGKGITLPDPFSPFSTSRQERPVGLGLALFRQSALLTGGSAALAPRPCGGTCVSGSFLTGSINFRPLGDVAGVLAAVASGCGEAELILRLRKGGTERCVSLRQLRRSMGGLRAEDCRVIGRFKEEIERLI